MTDDTAKIANAELKAAELVSRIYRTCDKTQQMEMLGLWSQLVDVAIKGKCAASRLAAQELANRSGDS